MRHWNILVAALAVAVVVSALPSQAPGIRKNCIDNCKCKPNDLPSRLQVHYCDGPLTINETTFRYIIKPIINVISFENVIIDQIQEGAFREFTNLEDVVIVKSKIGLIDAKAFNNIKKLKFADCGFEDSPDLFSEKLEELHFGNCQLEEIPKLNDLLSLTFLNLSGNYIKDIGIETFAELFDLEELYLSDNEIFKLPATLFINNLELNSLYLDNNPLQHFYLNTSENLETLSLKNCQLETFDERSTQRLSTLNDLNLSNNKIKTLSSKALGHMKELSVINLSNNKLEKLDEDIFSLNRRLIKITLDGNNFQTLPNFFLKDDEKFTTYTFSCKHCGLKTLSNSVFKNMAGMINLELSHNEFMNIDNVFDKIASLKILDISYNNIAYISPTAFVNNTNLEQLNIAGNPLMVLNPEVFAKNRVLKEIDARNTSLQKLWSNNNNKIVSLKKLLLGNNQLTTLTIEDFKLMPRLAAIDLSHNNLIFTDKFCDVINWLERAGVSPIEQQKSIDLGGERSFGEDIDGYSFILWKDLHNRKCPDLLTTTAAPIKPFNEDIYKEDGGDDDDEDLDDSTTDDYDEDDYNSIYDIEMEAENSVPRKFVENERNENELARASYILSVTSVFVLTALLVLTVAVTLTLFILRRNNNFNMHKANLPRLKIPLWYSVQGQKKHSGSVYRPLSEELCGPKTPKLSRYEFTTTPTVHSSNP